jgi:hypothetical protein
VHHVGFTILVYRVRHKSVNTRSLSHERLVIIIGPYFIHGTLTGERERVMLEEDVFPDLLNPDMKTG